MEGNKYSDMSSRTNTWHKKTFYAQSNHQSREHDQVAVKQEYKWLWVCSALVERRRAAEWWEFEEEDTRLDLCDSYSCSSLEDDEDSSFELELDTSSSKHARDGVKPFACDECEYTCTRKSNLTSHIWAHIGMKSFACDESDYVYRKGDLTSHMICADSHWSETVCMWSLVSVSILVQRRVSSQYICVVYSDWLLWSL